MYREFVPYEEALVLKELGYKGDIIGMYDEDKYLFTLHEQDDIEDEWLPAPLYQQAFRWFRENHGTNELIFSDGYQWTWDIRMIDKEDIMQYPSRVYPENERLRVMSNTYQEAEIACLRKLIEIVKLKKIK